MKNFKNFWFQVLKRRGASVGAFDPVNTLRVPDLAKPIVQETGKHAAAFSAVVTLNQAVHCERYNSIILEHVKTMNAAGSASVMGSQ